MTKKERGVKPVLPKLKMIIEHLAFNTESSKSWWAVTLGPSIDFD